MKVKKRLHWICNDYANHFVSANYIEIRHFLNSCTVCCKVSTYNIQLPAQLRSWLLYGSALFHWCSCWKAILFRFGNQCLNGIFTFQCHCCCNCSFSSLIHMCNQTFCKLNILFMHFRSRTLKYTYMRTDLSNSNIRCIKCSYYYVEVHIYI